MSGEHLRQQRRSAANALFANRLQKALQSGGAWIYREYQTLSAGGTFDTVLKNPDSSDVSLLVSRFIEATGGITGTIRVNPTIDASGTAFPRVNATGRDPEVADDVATVEYGGTYSGGTDRLPVQFPTTGATKGGQGGATFQVDPGATVEYDLTSDDNDNLVEFEFLVAEVPTDVDM